MAEFPAMPLWTDAYLGDTTHLTTIEHGAYLLLLIAMWRNKGALPNDDRLLARYAGLTAGQWKRIKPILWPFFTVSGDTISQGRLTDEAKAVRQRSAKQSDRAKARWLKTKETGDAAAMPGGCRNDAPHTHIHKEEDKSSSIPRKRGTRLSPDWVLPMAWGEWAIGEGWSEHVVRIEADKFKDFWIAKTGRDATKVDWQATWRNWMRNSKASKIIEGTVNEKPSKQQDRMRAFLAGARETS